MRPSSSQGKVRPLFRAGRTPKRSKREIWEDFAADRALLEARNVRPEELEALEQIAMLGSIESKADLVFILSAMRRPRRK